MFLTKDYSTFAKESNGCVMDKKKRAFWIIVVAITLFGCGGEKHQTNSTVQQPDGVFNYEKPVDLSDVMAAYEERMANEESDWMEPEGWTEGMGYELFEDTSFAVSVPQYQDSKQPFLQGAEDFYNSCALMHNLRSNVEMVFRELSTEEDVVKSIREIGVDFLHNKDLRERAQVFKDSLIIVLQKPDEESGEEDNFNNIIAHFTQDIEEHAVQFYTDEEAFVDSLDSVGNLMQKMTEKQFQIYRSSSEDQRVKVMLEQLNQCDNFDQQCSLFLNWANSQESSDEDEWVVMVAERLMRSGKYNPMLFNIWLDWRCLTQGMLGASRDSEIPNQMYNQMRKICYLTCLKRIEAYPQDVLAMNSAVVLAGRVNILRIGRFMFGNDGIIEIHEFMPNRFPEE